MLNTKIVEDFSLIPQNPIIAAVTISGIKLGITEINTILHDENNPTIQSEIKIIAKTND